MSALTNMIRRNRGTYSKKTLARTIIIMMGLATIPLIYAGLLSWANIDPTGHLDHVPAAIVNEDAGSTDPKLTLGKDLTEELTTSTKRNNFKWRTMSAEDAQRALNDGDVYAVLTIPKDFSANAASVGENDAAKAKRAQLTITTSDATNMISGNIAQTIATEVTDTLKEEVGAKYLENIYAGFTTINENVTKAKDGARDLSDGTRKARNGSADLVVGLGDLADGSVKLQDGTAQIAQGAGDVDAAAHKVQGGAGELASGAQQVDSATGKVADGSKALNSGAQQLEQGISDAHAGSTKLTDGLGQLEEKTAQLPEKSAQLDAGAAKVDEGAAGLQDGAAKLDDGAAKLDEGAGQLSTGADALSAGATQLNDGATELDGSVDELLANWDSLPEPYRKAALEKIAGGTEQLQQGTELNEAGAAKLAAGAGSLSDGASQVHDGASQLHDGASKLSDGASQLHDGTGALAESSTTLADAIAQAHTGAASLDSGLGKLEGGAKSLTDGTGELASGSAKLKEGTASLSDGAGTLAEGSGKLADGTSRLKDASTKVENGASTLSSGAKDAKNGAGELQNGLGKVDDGAHDLESGLADGAKDIPSYSEADADALAGVGSDPVTLTKQRKHEVASYGYGLAPYFMSLSLWVGALGFFLMVTPLSSRLVGSQMPSPFVALLSYVSAAIMGVVQAVLMVATVHYGVGITFASLDKAFWVAIAASVTFMAINQALVALLGPPGRYLSLVLTVLQLSAAGATYPIETTPGIFQTLHDILPLTHLVKALRAAIAGGPVHLGDAFASFALYWVGAILALSVGVTIQRRIAGRSAAARSVQTDLVEPVPAA